MSHKHVWILGLALAILWTGCTASRPAGTGSSLAGAVEMTCTAATWRSRGDNVGGGQTGRNQCTMAKGPDGKEVPVRVIDSGVGAKLSCTETEGKIRCPSVPLAMFTRPTPWFNPSPNTFPPFDAAP